MNNKLNYEEWCNKYMLANVVTDEDRKKFKLQKIDIDKQIEEARLREYEFYINGGFEE
jgi:hypothetical protein